MTSWLIRFWLWVKEASVFWLGIIVLAVALLTAFLPAMNEPRIRLVGLLLQLCGVTTVVWGISQTWRFFGAPSLSTLARNWLESFPKFKRSVIMAASAGTVGLSGGSVRGHVWSNPSSNASLEDRVSVLERNLGRLKDVTYGLQSQVDDEVRSRENAIASEHQLREQADLELRQRLEAAETSGLHVSLVGIIWLVVGLILSTMATEIIRLFD